MDEYTAEAVQLLREMIAIPSPSFQEDAVCSHICQWMKDRDIDHERIGNNIIAEHICDPSKPTLMLCAHIDTVEPCEGYTFNPYNPENCPADIVQGLGSNDDGASLVTMLQVFYQICQNPQKYNTIFLASAEEEVSGKNGIEAVFPLLPPVTCAIIGEPTGMHPAVAEKGLMVLDCVASGVAGHAARNEGVNAIYKAMDDINWFRNYKYPESSPLLGDVKMTVTQVNAGKQHNVIPDNCSYVVDIRSNECYSNNELLDIIKSNVGSEVKARSTRLNSSSISPDHPLVQCAVELGRKPYGSPTLSNQALLNIPTLKMGPGESSRSHTANEFIRISEIREGIKLFASMLDGLKL